ncbi:hypothetical protein DCAR_0729427 [Daucus carota subsp. sativus]|uniref:Uncharacterized protein n=1 Tax=Daucus carota subsp. sativus TaxID=79200 RepID=A0A164U5S2_DAUCS|nr:PREDICTED: inverted formin-2-like [Daucus carota subsp. sativus]WOH09966.1 hypothetical protein DCAR_0729427 [Daucus carota subsp. sativus]
MKSIITIISTFFLFSLFTILGTQARILPAAGEIGTFEFNNINLNEEKEWMSMVAEQIINNLKKTPLSPPPPPPTSSPTSNTILTTDPLKPNKMSGYGTIAKSPPPPPYASPTKGHVSSTILKPWMRQGDLGKTPQSPPPSPNTSPAKDDSYIRSSGTIKEYRRSLKSPPPRDIWMASTFIADC